MAKAPSLQSNETMSHDLRVSRIDLILSELKKCYSLSAGEVLKNLNKFYKRKEIQRLGAENGLDGKKMF